MGTVGLYYPFIHFKDDNWLKVSALYWDRMARIVPPSYSGTSGESTLKRDSVVTRQLIDRFDFVVNVPPTEATYPVSELFSQLILQHAGRLRERYDVRNCEEWPIDPVTERYAQLRNPHLAYVNSSKLHPDLIKQLQDEHIVMEHVEGDEYWAGMHPRLAFVYMSALAEEAATDNGLHPTTDETLDHLATAGWSLPRLAAALLDDPSLANEATVGADDEHSGNPWSHEELRASLALISIRMTIPRDLSALSVEKIAQIREEFGPELFRFQQFVDEAADRLPNFGAHAEPAVVAAQLQVAYEHEIRPVVQQLRQALQGRGLDTVEGAMGTSIAMPAALSPIAVNDPVTFGAAAVLSLIPVLRARRRQAREVYQQSRAAYLYRLDQELQPRQLLGWLGQGIRRFLTGV